MKIFITSLLIVLSFFIGYFLGSYDFFKPYWLDEFKNRAITHIINDKSPQFKGLKEEDFQDMKMRYFSSRYMRCVNFSPQTIWHPGVYGSSYYYCEDSASGRIQYSDY